jgi:shikimate kinase
MKMKSITPNKFVNKKIFYLTGFMGSGKSTIGPILANTLGWEFYDLDKVIEDKSGKLVKEIFEIYGEDYFRNLETESLLELSVKENVIIALGGGTIASDGNIAILKKTGIIVYLKMSPESAMKRLKFKRNRPVLFSDLKENFTNEDLLNRITELYEKRRKYYDQSDIIIDTDDIPIGRTIDNLARIVQQETKRQYEKD